MKQERKSRSFARSVGQSPVKIITLKRIVAYTFLVELYNVLVILLGILLHSESPLEDKGFWEIVAMFVYTVIPELVNLCCRVLCNSKKRSVLKELL